MKQISVRKNSVTKVVPEMTINYDQTVCLRWPKFVTKPKRIEIGRRSSLFAAHRHIEFPAR